MSFAYPSRPPSTTSALEPDPRASPFAPSHTGLTNAFDVFGVGSAAGRLQLPSAIHYPGPIRFGGMASYRLTESRPELNNTSLLTRTLPPPNASTTSHALLSSTAVTPSNPSSAEPTPPASPSASTVYVNSDIGAPPNSTVQTILATLQKLTEPQNVENLYIFSFIYLSTCALVPPSKSNNPLFLFRKHMLTAF